MFLVCFVFVCLSIRPSDNLKCNERICMKRVPEVCLETTSSIFGMMRIRITIHIARICIQLSPEVCLGPRTNPLTFRDDPDYDQDPDYDN